MKFKAIIAMAAAVCICGVTSGCGSSNSDKDLESALDGMTDEQLESAVEEGASKIDEADNSSEVAASIVDTEEPEEIVYEPTDEILNAELSSGLVQIGNDIFRNGGYYTVDQFIAEFGDRYDMSEINVEGLVKKNQSDHFKIVSLNDPNLTIQVNYLNWNSESEKGRIGDAVVSDVGVVRTIGVKSDNCWYPQGVSRNGDGYNYNNIPEFYENNGFKAGDGNNENYLNYGVYWEKSECIYARERGTEENLTGHYPIYEYCFQYKSEDAEAIDFRVMVYTASHGSGIDDFTPMS